MSHHKALYVYYLMHGCDEYCLKKQNQLEEEEDKRKELKFRREWKRKQDQDAAAWAKAEDQKRARLEEDFYKRTYVSIAFVII